MELKRLYSESEINDLLHWFEENKDNLPQTLQLYESSFIPNVPQTVKAFCTLAHESRKNSTFSAQLKILFDIREKLQES